MAIQNVAFVGASSALGPSILAALRAHSVFVPYVLNRHSSKSVYPKTRVITVPDDLNVEEVTQLLKENSIDALVVTIKPSYIDEQKRLIDAAFNARVKRLIPADFGSCDSADDDTNTLMPFYGGKKRIREYLVAKCAEDRPGDAGRLTWTSLISGHFFDWGLGNETLRFNVKARKAYLQDGGDIKFSTSNLPFIAGAVIKILEKEDKTKNQILYVHSHYVTQNEVLASLEKAMGERFERVNEDSKTVIAEVRPRMLAGDYVAYEEVVAVHGVVASDWSRKEGFANQLLDLEEEDLDEAIKRALRSQGEIR